MFPKFFRLIRNGIKPEHIDDKVQGRTLDKLFDIDVSKVYFELASKVVKHLKLSCDALNLDGTGFHVGGRYNCDDESSMKFLSAYDRARATVGITART